jgi:hypothetical protein
LGVTPNTQKWIPVQILCQRISPVFYFNTWRAVEFLIFDDEALEKELCEFCLETKPSQLF